MLPGVARAPAIVTPAPMFSAGSPWLYVNVPVPPTTGVAKAVDVVSAVANMATTAPTAKRGHTHFTVFRRILPRNP